MMLCPDLRGILLRRWRNSIAESMMTPSPGGNLPSRRYLTHCSYSLQHHFVVFIVTLISKNASLFSTKFSYWKKSPKEPHKTLFLIAVLSKILFQRLLCKENGDKKRKHRKEHRNHSPHRNRFLRFPEEGKLRAQHRQK